jgi:hypothetical protein
MSLSTVKQALARGLGVMGAAAFGLFAFLAVHGMALATDLDGNKETIGKPYYYGGYPGPPTWFWIIAFSCIVSAVVVFVADASVRNAKR